MRKYEVAFSDIVSLQRHSKRMMLLFQRGRKNIITNNERYMIQYVLTKNIKERHDIPFMEKVWGTETVHQTFSVCQILIALLLWEDFCQLLCHALSE